MTRSPDEPEVCLKEGRGEPEWGIAARSCALREGEGPRIREGGTRSRLRMGCSVPSPRNGVRWLKKGRPFERTIPKPLPATVQV